MTFRLLFFFPLILFFSLSCTSSRWVVVDDSAVNEEVEAETISERNIVSIEKEPTVEDPVIRFSVNQVVQKEFEQRVMVERSIQRYSPKWGIWALGLSAATFAGVAANTDMIHSSTSKSEAIALNLTAAVLAGITVTQMKPVGESIYTGETRMLRRSGFQTVVDTLNVADIDEEVEINMTVSYRNEVIFEELGLPTTDGSLSLNIASVISDSSLEVEETGTILVDVEFDGTMQSYAYPVADVFMPYVEVKEPVTVLRNAPGISELNIVTEVGQGSAFRLLEAIDENWYRVRFGGSDVFIQQDVTNITWISEASTSSIDVYEFVDIPFGEIDVESSVPILRQNNPDDKAIIISNSHPYGDEPVQYLERDFQLFEFYMSSALQMREYQISRVHIDSTEIWTDEFFDISSSDSTGLLYLYLDGEAVMVNGELHLKTSQQQFANTVSLETIFDTLADLNPEKMIVLADLDISTSSPFSNDRATSPEVVLQRFVSNIQRRIPNSAIVFSHKPDQQSGLYTGGGVENKRHRIFTYYWADAIKKRNVVLSDIIRHLENNVDYTSRRLHDRPQEIQAFGNLTISVRE